MFRTVLAIAACLAPAAALAWEARDDEDGTYIIGLGDLDAPMTGMQISCPSDSGPQIFVIVPEDRRGAYPGVTPGVVAIDGTAYTAWFKEVLDGYNLYDSETDVAAAGINAALIPAMKAGTLARVGIESNGTFVELGSLSLSGFTRAYDSLRC